MFSREKIYLIFAILLPLGTNLLLTFIKKWLIIECESEKITFVKLFNKQYFKYPYTSNLFLDNRHLLNRLCFSFFIVSYETMYATKSITFQRFITILALFYLKNSSHSTITQIKNFMEKVVVFVDVLEFNIALLKCSFIFKISTTEQTIFSFYILYFLIFFLSGFSFTNAHNSKDSRGRKRLSL